MADNYIIYEPDGKYTYGQQYWDEYKRRECSNTSIVLCHLRMKLVENYLARNLLDIGIGSGAFIKYIYCNSESIKASGYDVNEYGIRWLENKGIYFNYIKEDITKFDTITYWDSFEHLTKEEHAHLHRCKRGTHVFISIPIISRDEDVKKNKHYKPAEHLWYFTSHGLRGYMTDYHFECLETNDIEMRAGRKDIHTFVFRKK